MAREIYNGPEKRDYCDIVLQTVGFYVAWNNLEESQGPKERKEVIDLNVAPLGLGIVFETRNQVRGYAEQLQRRIKYDPHLPVPKEEREYLEAHLRASLAYLTALNGYKQDFHHYVHETQQVYPREFSEGEIGEAQSQVLQMLHGLDYKGDFANAIGHFREENGLSESQILGGVISAAEKFLPIIREYTGIDVDPTYRVIPVNINAPWRAWLKTERGEIILEINLSHPEGWVRGQEERIGLHEVPIHGTQIASWRQSSEAGIISPASCVTTLHTPEQISIEGLATSLPLIQPELFPLTPFGKLSVKLDYLERLVLHNAHIRANLLSPLATRRERDEIVEYVVNHLPYMKFRDVRDRLERRSKDAVDRAYELSYSEGARLHIELFEQLGRNSELFRRLVREEFLRPMTADQIRKFASQLREGKIREGNDISSTITPLATGL
ncbi:hypothetical protein A2Z23_00790 [Candidatus Curtissbacteria bacterium RBG_16_39_7]|uniref:Uncharacterized protein n=1 Tax=Candidatus Curtissbacteria bacterium RBG_16_39_7 TaxID=1797707 RepID=A0A1F5G1P9_9BACT|nr:MAG: hypothetical protein A2Z23_00790 [Candidatus Curtissbacteria bacterium RBG_16_39_7]